MTTCVRCGWAVERNLNSGEWLDEWGSPLCETNSPQDVPHKGRTPENEPSRAVTKL